MKKIEYKDNTYKRIEDIVYKIFEGEIEIEDPMKTTEQIVNMINNKEIWK